MYCTLFSVIHTIQKREEKIVKNDKLQMILAMVIFGTIGLVRRYIPYPSEWIAFIRGFVGVSFLLLLQMLHKKTFVWEPVKHNLALLLVSGACYDLLLHGAGYCDCTFACGTKRNNNLEEGALRYGRCGGDGFGH